MRFSSNSTLYGNGIAYFFSLHCTYLSDAGEKIPKTTLIFFVLR